MFAAKALKLFALLSVCILFCSPWSAHANATSSASPVPSIRPSVERGPHVCSIFSETPQNPFRLFDPHITLFKKTDNHGFAPAGYVKTAPTRGLIQFPEKHQSQMRVMALNAQHFNSERRYGFPKTINGRPIANYEVASQGAQSRALKRLASIILESESDIIVLSEVDKLEDYPSFSATELRNNYIAVGSFTSAMPSTGLSNEATQEPTLGSNQLRDQPSKLSNSPPPARPQDPQEKFIRSDIRDLSAHEMETQLARTYSSNEYSKTLILVRRRAFEDAHLTVSALYEREMGMDSEEAQLLASQFYRVPPFLGIYNSSGECLFIIGGLHLKSSRGSRPDPTWARRMQEIRRRELTATMSIVQRIQSLPHHKNATLLLGGDWNVDLSLTSTDIDVLRESGFYAPNPGNYIKPNSKSDDYSGSNWLAMTGGPQKSNPLFKEGFTTSWADQEGRIIPARSDGFAIRTRRPTAVKNYIFGFGPHRHETVVNLRGMEETQYEAISDHKVVVMDIQDEKLP